MGEGGKVRRLLLLVNRQREDDSEEDRSGGKIGVGCLHVVGGNPHYSIVYKQIF